MISLFEGVLSYIDKYLYYDIMQKEVHKEIVPCDCAKGELVMPIVTYSCAESGDSGEQYCTFEEHSRMDVDYAYGRLATKVFVEARLPSIGKSFYVTEQVDDEEIFVMDQSGGTGEKMEFLSSPRGNNDRPKGHRSWRNEGRKPLRPRQLAERRPAY